MADPKVPQVRTHVARAGYTRHAFRGHDLFADLLGQASWTEMAVLAVGGRRLEAREVRWLEAVACALTVADPRIWPPKVSRLAAARGDFLMGLAAAVAAMSGSRVGSGTVDQAAVWLQDLVASGEEDVLAAVSRLRKTSALPAGFGVPVREQDERWKPLDGALGDDVGPHVRMARQIHAQVTDPPRPNVSLMTAAVMLDVGLKPEQMPALGTLMLTLPLGANALEESLQRNRSMQSMPRDHIRDASPKLRRSPRFSRADSLA